MKKVIYQNGEGVSILHPTGEIPIEDVAKKDVPAGVPYLIVDESVIPSDRYFRDAWEADFSKPHGVGIGHDEWTRLHQEGIIKKIESIDASIKKLELDDNANRAEKIKNGRK